MAVATLGLHERKAMEKSILSMNTEKNKRLMNENMFRELYVHLWPIQYNSRSLCLIAVFIDENKEI